MEIIKEGRDWNKWSIEYECRNNGYSGCNSLLKINVDDISYYLDEDWDEYYSFCCPCCGKQNCIKKSIIPNQVKDIIKCKNRR